MFAWLRLFRVPNLLMIALTQFLVRNCIIMPAYITEFMNSPEDAAFPEHLSQVEFMLLVFATLIIAAGGYVINDVFDIYTDEINKPGKNVVGKRISEKTARTISYLFFAIGSIIGIVVAVKKQVFMMGLIFPFSSVSLYMYASYYKRRILIGNILIALLSSFAVLIIALFEPGFYLNIQFVLVYAIFAFLISLVREIIKDAEDIDGDERTECKTFPVRFGLGKTKILVAFLILITSGIITFFLHLYFYNNKVINFWYLFSMFIIPFTALIYLVFTANEKKDYSYASLFAKLVMVFGILTIIPFYYYFLK